MIDAISLNKTSTDELYELRKALLSDISNKNLSKKQEETPKELSQKQINKEIRLSSRNEEIEDVDPQEEQEAENIKEGIVVSAGGVGVLASNNIELQANIKSEDSDYDEDMDYNEDGKVSDEERIRYYSEKYQNTSTSSQNSQTESAFEVPNFDNLTSKKSENTTNPIVSNMSLINKMQANYGKTTPEVQTGLTILV